MNVYCANCENECSEAAAACPKCGHPLRPAAMVHETMPCPGCGKQIIPQWTYLGRQFSASISGFGIENYGRARLCPLCGVDVDQAAREQAQRQAGTGEAGRWASATPAPGREDNGAAWLMDRLKLLAWAVVLLMVFVALCVPR